MKHLKLLKVSRPGQMRLPELVLKTVYICERFLFSGFEPKHVSNDTKHTHWRLKMQMCMKKVFDFFRAIVRSSRLILSLIFNIEYLTHNNLLKFD